MGRECCRAGAGTLSIRIHQRAVRFTPGRRLVTPRPGAPRQGREQPGPAAAPRPRAARIWRLFVIRHAAPDTRIPAGSPGANLLPPACRMQNVMIGMQLSAASRLLLPGWPCPAAPPPWKGNVNVSRWLNARGTDGQPSPPAQARNPPLWVTTITNSAHGPEVRAGSRIQVPLTARESRSCRRLAWPSEPSCRLRPPRPGDTR